MTEEKNEPMMKVVLDVAVSGSVFILGIAWLFFQGMSVGSALLIIFGAAWLLRLIDSIK